MMKGSVTSPLPVPFYVIIVWNGDPPCSGIRTMLGPYTSQDEAQADANDLYDTGMQTQVHPVEPLIVEAP